MPQAPPPPLPIPGNHLEGGGQLLRNALTLSILTSTPIHVTRIRGKRPSGGGLKAQHVSCVATLAMLSQASVGRIPDKHMYALSRGMNELYFRPGMGAEWIEKDGRAMWGARMGGRVPIPQLGQGEGEGEGDRVIEVDIGSNGAVTLVLQAILPIVIFGAYKYTPPQTSCQTPSTNTPQQRTKSTILITGGTNVSFSPSIEYLTQILFPTLTNHLHLPPLSLTLLKRAWPGSSELGNVKVSVEQLNPGEGINGFRIEPDERGERVGKVVVTLVVPTEREVEVWSEVAKAMVKGMGVGGWRVPARKVKQEEVEQVVETMEKMKVEDVDGEVEVEVEISPMSMATLASSGSVAGSASAFGSTSTPRASGVGGASAQSYYVMIHTVSTPSGYLMAYDALHTAPKSAKLPALVGALDNKRSSIPYGRKKGGGRSKHTSTSDADTPEDPALEESRTLAHSLIRKILLKLQPQWAAGEVIDEYLRDQLVIYQALATGESFLSGGTGEMGKLAGQEVSFGLKDEGGMWGGGSLHTQTARWIANLVGGVEWDGEWKAGCRGLGLMGGGELGKGQGTKDE